MLKKHINFIES